MSFQRFAQLVHERFLWLSQFELFVVGEDSKVFFETYLKAFPAGTDPIYKTNTQHTCSCCRNFIEHFGRVVAIMNDRIETVWQVDDVEEPYCTVAVNMDEFVRSQPITSLFRTKEQAYGAESNVQLLENNGTKKWYHFHGRTERKHLTNEPATAIGEYGSRLQVFYRGLEEITKDALITVCELIKANQLYRGAEFEGIVTAFQNVHAKYHKLNTGGKSLFTWRNAFERYATIRSTAIGTLLIDLSTGMATEDAVRSFEAKVAPQNYKRTTALVTPRMIEEAFGKVKELGLEHALERRLATTQDLNIGNVLWADQAVQPRMKGAAGMKDMLLGESRRLPPQKDGIQMTIERFQTDVLPKAKRMELLVEGRHKANLMTLTAPKHEDAGRLFRWPNNFAWSYNGNVTDSIKERVKRAGGNVTNAKLRVSLAWFNTDDLDLHVIEPGGFEICFRSKVSRYGSLDVDMNVYNLVRNAVENVSWTNVPDGVYKVFVDCFSRRETIDVGCTVEIENQGRIVQLSHERALGRMTPVCNITMKDGVVTDIAAADGVSGRGITQEVWNIKTESMVPVSMVLNSPNHWDGHAVGNKHWFFLLKDCRNPEPVRGIYNEFLKGDLEPHRKVFELLGNKTMCEPHDEQLSGMGFSSTKPDQVKVMVDDGQRERLYTLTFASSQSVTEPAPQEALLIQ